MNKSKKIALRFLANSKPLRALNKRGSHVGMVLSFVIFVTFLIFLYSILEPATKTQKDKQALLDYLKIELIERFSADLTSATVSTRGGQENKYKCLEINYSILDIEDPQNISLVIYNETRGPVSFKFEGDYLIIDKFGDGQQFFKIYYSEEPLNNSAGASVCEGIIKSDEWATVGLIRTDEYIFETKIIDLINEYETSYGNLKNELNIPIGSEFGFSFTYTNKTVIGTSEKNVSTSVYAEEIPIQYIDREASVNSGFINIRVW